MAHRLRPVGIDFVETAPVRLVFAREIAAPPDAVFGALNEDVPGWSEWFSAVTSRLGLPVTGPGVRSGCWVGRGSRRPCWWPSRRRCTRIGSM
jgi:hypothetical protein